MATDLVPFVPALPAELPAHQRLVRSWLESKHPKTVRAYKADLRDLARFLRVANEEAACAAVLALGQGAANLTALDWRTDMTRRGLSPATVGRRLTALRSFVELANTVGAIAWKVEVESPERVAYRDTRGPGADAVRKAFEMLSVSPTPRDLRDVAVLRLLYNHGLRREEVCQLDLAHYDKARPAVHVLGKKRVEREWITLAASTAAALDAWIEVRPQYVKGDGPLFVGVDNAHGHRRLTGDGVRFLVVRLGARLGVKFRPHGVRHTAITAVLDRNGGDLRAASRFSRHRDLNTLQKYDDNRRDIAKDMADLLDDTSDPAKEPK